MKNVILLFSVIFILFSCGETPQKAKSQTAATTGKSMIEVLDFYGTHRCMTCEAIEANTRYTVESLFPEEVKSGKIVFKTINVDDEANWDMAEKYEATGTALFLNVIDNEGKEKHYNLTEFAFDKGNDKEEFSAKLKAKIAAQLKNL